MKVMSKRTSIVLVIPRCTKHMKVMRERTRVVLVSGRCTANMEVTRERTSVVLVSPFSLTRLVWVFQKLEN
jgi:hypothetical protein